MKRFGYVQVPIFVDKNLGAAKIVQENGLKQI
jgi:hypothetical protein